MEEEMFHDLACIKVRLTDLLFLNASFFSLIKKMGLYFPFSLIWNFTRPPHLSIMDSGLANSITSFLKTQGCISSDLKGLCTSGVLRYSRTLFLPTVGSSSFSQLLSFLSAALMVWLLHFLVKTEKKNSLSISDFSMSQVTRYFVLFWRGLCLSKHSFMYIWDRSID